MNTYHLDYETRSKADLKKVGAYRYANNPSTRILMFGIARNNEKVLMWDCVRGGAAALALLFEALNSGDEIWAHNSEFECAVSKYRMLLDLGFDPPAISRWRCTAALARKAALPPSLGNACEALNLGQQKYGRGSVLMRKFSIPRKEDGEFNRPEDFMPEFIEFCDVYCKTDVEAERGLHAALTPFILRGATLATFQFTATLNHRGLPVNVKALEHTQKIIDAVQAEVTAKFEKLTGLQPTQRDRVKTLLKNLGFNLTDMKAKTLDEAVTSYHADEEEEEDPIAALSDEEIQMLGGDAVEIIKLYKMVSFAAIKKVRAMLNCACDDGRVRGTLLYHAAGTGRPAGRLVQPQNFKKPTIKDTDICYAMLCAGCSREEIEMMFGNPLEAIASCIRNFIQDPQFKMFDADYAAIEARIVCWLAGQEDALQDFREKKDQYIKMAAAIYGRPISAIKNPSEERELGKRCVLGCGFQMGWEKFKKTSWDLYRVKVSDELAQRAVTAYREQFFKVADLWEDVGDAAKKAIASPGNRFEAGEKLSFIVQRFAGVEFLLMKLPSGRNIAYPHPRIEQLEGDKWPGITFWGPLKKGSSKWGRVRTYGGKLVENATQATAADIMHNGGDNCEAAGFEICVIVHDQAMAPAKPGLTLEQFIKCLTTLPEWAAGLPITAEGKLVPYYKKS